MTKFQALADLTPANEQYLADQDVVRASQSELIRRMRVAKAAGATQQEIAEIVGLSRQRVSQFLAR